MLVLVRIPVYVRAGARILEYEYKSTTSGKCEEVYTTPNRLYIYNPFTRDRGRRPLPCTRMRSRRSPPKKERNRFIISDRKYVCHSAVRFAVHLYNKEGEDFTM